jgi:2-polyprenyl-6-methoxyphenol hydroxylase-like FAD-dependent oxidoreductase
MEAFPTAHPGIPALRTIRVRGTVGQVKSTQVLIAGAGPVGLILAIDLGLRGIPCTIVEKNAAPARIPKLERCNARTMEIFRRLGIAERVRAAGFPRHLPMDVFVVTSTQEPPILQLAYPSVAQMQADIAAHNDGTRPLEPYQLISQYTLEPVLKAIAEELPTVDVCFGQELISFEQDPQGVTALVRAAGGTEATIRTSYLAGCDGGSSLIRKTLGIKLEGRGGIREMRRTLFRSNDLFERIRCGKGRHYHIADDEFTTIVVQDDTKHFTMSTLVDTRDDPETHFRRVVGLTDIDLQTQWTGTWKQHLLLAERYGEGRVFLAGDAAHLVIPTGALGMNTGAGDAVDLAWKLAGTLAGWGGPALLASYLSERRQIGARNVAASGRATEGRVSWRSAYRPWIAERTPAGEAARSEMARIADVEQRKTNEMPGIELGYRYVDSPLIATESGSAPHPDSIDYVPTTWPGARLPHVWLDDGTALHDRLGRGFSLLKLAATRAETGAIQRAFGARQAPLDVLEFPDNAVRELYGYDLLLVRPDLHVVWRGNASPADADLLAARATGNATLALQGVDDRPKIPSSL